MLTDKQKSDYEFAKMFFKRYQEKKSEVKRMEAEGKDTKPRTGVVNFERRKYPRFSVDLPLEYY